MTTTQRISDPLVAAIDELKSGMAAYDRHPDAGEAEEKKAVQETYGPPLERIQRWQAPAVTRRGAMQALRLASGDLNGAIDTELVESMVKAALRYFETEETDGRIASEDDIDAVHDVLAFLDIAGSLLNNGVSDREAGSLVWLMGNARGRLRQVLTRMEEATAPAPVPPAPAGLADTISNLIGGMVDHRDLHTLFDVMVDLERNVGSTLCQPRHEDGGPAVDALQALVSFFGDQVEAIRDKAKETPPISREAGHHRALILLGYEMNNSAFADELLAVARAAAEDIDRMAFPD